MKNINQKRVLLLIEYTHTCEFIHKFKPNLNGFELIKSVVQESNDSGLKGSKWLNTGV